MGLPCKPAREPAVAIYSLHHSAIGKGTQERPHTASAHVAYITRARALTHLEGERMPTEPQAAMEHLQAAEDKDRANARVIDKVMLALPRELDARQRHELVRAFAEEVTDGRAAWLAAFHEGGKDAENPHVHLVIRDRDAETGRRVAHLSERGSTERLRKLWEEHANRALAQAQRPERIDRRTLKAQGISRKPTIHEGVRARRLAKKGRPIHSRTRQVRNAALARTRSRRVDYPRIDRGQTRAAYNATVRTRTETERALWAAYDDDARTREFEALSAVNGAPDDDFDPEAWLGGRKLRMKKKRSRSP